MQNSTHISSNRELQVNVTSKYLNPIHIYIYIVVNKAVKSSRPKKSTYS